jgi:hypothetical protein
MKERHMRYAAFAEVDIPIFQISTVTCGALIDLVTPDFEGNISVVLEYDGTLTRNTPLELDFQRRKKLSEIRSAFWQTIPQTLTRTRIQNPKTLPETLNILQT